MAHNLCEVVRADVEVTGVNPRLAEQIGGWVAAAERELVRSSAGAWAGFGLPRYRDREVRQCMHADAVRALAGVAAAGDDRLGHVSDWLRLQACLLLGVPAKHRDEARGLLEGQVRRALEQAVTDDERGSLLAALAELHAELPAALAAFDCLRDLNAIDDFTRSNIEDYWDASARDSALFTIDWASFGREDLFDHNGWRAASWLAEHGHAGEGDRILQIGCGAGRIERHLASRVGHVYGVDISAEMIGLAEVRLAGLDNVTLVHGDGRNLALPDHSVETVFSFLVLVHVHDDEVKKSLVQEAFRVLVPGGKCLITLPSRDWLLEIGARLAGFRIARSAPVASRRIDSFSYEPDWLVELARPD